MAKSNPEKSVQFEYIVVAGKHQDTNEDGSRYYAYAGESVMLAQEEADKFSGKFRRAVVEAPVTEQADASLDKAE